MRIAMLAVGSRGDMQPSIILGKELRARGHDVCVGALAHGRALVERAGLEFKLVPELDMDDFSTPEVIAALKKGPSRVRLIRALPKHSPEMAARYLKNLENIAAQADFVVHTVVTMSVAFAMPDPPPWCFLPSWPNHVTGDFPAMDLPNLGNIRWYNRLTHRLSLNLEWSLWRRNEVNMLRAEHGLSPVPKKSKLDELGTTVPVIYPYSPAVVPVPPEWPSNTHVTGYLFADEERPPQPDVDDFLDDGDPPFVVSMGSGWVLHKEIGTAQVMVRAARALGLRTIIVGGPGGIEGDDVLDVNEMDFRKVLPRTVAGIHHGGSGTTGEFCRAGVPQILFPTLADNPFWARQVREIGVGVRPLTLRSNHKDVMAAIEEAATSTEMRRRAQELGVKVAAEKGDSAAADKVDEFYAASQTR